VLHLLEAVHDLWPRVSLFMDYDTEIFSLFHTADRFTIRERDWIIGSAGVLALFSHRPYPAAWPITSFSKSWASREALAMSTVSSACSRSKRETIGVTASSHWDITVMLASCMIADRINPQASSIHLVKCLGPIQEDQVKGLILSSMH